MPDFTGKNFHEFSIVCDNIIVSLRSCIYIKLLILGIIILQEDTGVYTQLVRDMVANGEYRLTVNINDLRKKNPQRVTG